MADIKDLISKARNFKLNKAISNVVSGLDRDKQQQGFQFTSPQFRQNINNAQKSLRYGLSGQSQGRQGFGGYNVFNQIKPTLFDPVSNFRFKTGGPSIGEAVQSTSQNVVQDFGRALSGENTFFGKTPVLKNLAQLSSRTGQTIASGTKDIGEGVYDVFDTAKSSLERIGGGGSKIVRGIGKVAAPTTAPFQLANIGSEVGPNQTQRFSSGFIQGMSGQSDLQGLPKSVKSVNVPFMGSIDPYETAGSMVGFTQNPVNKELFKLTETILPSNGNAVKWLTTTALRGSVEDLLLNLDQIINSENKTDALLSNMTQGAISELVGQGIIKSTGKGFEIVKDSRAGKLFENQLNNALEGLSEIKRKWSVPVKTLEQDPKTGEFITRPMWQVMLQNQQGGIGAKNDLLQGNVKTGDVVDPKTGNIVSSTPSKELDAKSTKTYTKKLLEVVDIKPQTKLGEISSLEAQTKPSQILQKLKTQQAEVAKKIQTSDSIIQQAKKEIGSITDEPKKPIKQIASDLYTQWVDRYNPIIKISEQVEKLGKKKGFEVRPEYDPKYLVRRLTGAGGIADYRFKNELKPILDEMDSLGIDKSDLDVFLKAKRDIGLSSRGIKGSDAITAQKRLNVLNQKYGDNLTNLSQKLYDYQNKGFQELIDSGFLSPESATIIRQQNPDYVPFERVMDELDNYLGVPSAKAQQGTSPISKIKGSERQIYSPIESIISNTFKQRAAIEKNNVAKSIIGLQQVAPDLGFEKAIKSGNDTITVWNNGSKEYWKVGGDIAEATKGLNEESMNTLLKIFSAPASLLRQGATGRNPEFLIPNIIRDQLDAGITSKYGYIPFVDYARGLTSILKNDDIYQKFQNSGAKIDLGDIRGRQSVSELFDEKTAKKGLFSWIGKGLDTLGKYSEEPTRVGLFKKAYEKTGSELKAVMESRDATVDFARMGSKMKVANSIIPFLNVSVQGFDKLVRSVKNNPGKVALTMGTYAALPQITTTLYNLTFHPEEYSEIPQYEKDSNFVFITGRNEDGTVDYMTIPKGNVVPLVANPVQAFLEFSRGESPQSFLEFSTQMLSSTLPVVGDGSSIGEVGIKTIGGLTPQLFKPVAENLLNKSFYKYDPKKEQAKAIVPDYLLKKPAGERAYEWTPKIYQGIGRSLNISPLQIQNVMEGYLAGFAKVPAQVVDGLFSLSNGEPVDVNQRTIIRRFIKQTYPKSGSSSEKNQAKAKIIAQATAQEIVPKGKIKTSAVAKNSSVTRDQALVLYKDALNKINNYKENKIKAQTGLVDKSLEEYQSEFDEANTIKRELEKQYSIKELLSSKYTDDLGDPPASKYGKSIYEDKIWSKLSDVESSNLNDYEKQIVKKELFSKIGLTEDKFEYYQVAKENNDKKTLYVLDQRDNIKDGQEFLKFLINGRNPVRGKVLLSDGVIDNLVNDGIIPSDIGKMLKKIDLDEKGKLKGKKTSSKKIKTVKFNYDALKSLKPFGGSARVSPIKINAKSLTFSGE